MSLTAQAETLADAAAGLGQSAATVTVSTWQSGADPDITAGVAGAAVALDCNPLTLRGPVMPMPDDKTFVEVCEDLWADLVAMLKAARALQRAAAEQRRAAAAAQAAAAAALAAARAALAAAMKADDSGAAAAAQADVNTARAAADAARARAADADACLDILAETGPRLMYAVRSLSTVPDDLEDTYQPHYDLVRAGGQLPHDGAWLAGTQLSLERQ